MWIFAKKGFVSVVADWADANKLLIRGRFKGDIEALFPGTKATETPTCDYRFRASVDRVIVGVRIAELVASINYPNFKNAAPKKRHGMLLRIWTLLINEQDRLHPRRWSKTKKVQGHYYDPLIGLPLLPGEDADLPWREYP